MPTVSVIIPTYNRSSLVKEAVNSVLSQSFRDFEILVVDDGSTDDTRDIIQNINDDRVKYYYKTNGGCASARNFGLEKMTGQYVCFLDSDDYWPENFLQCMVEKLDKNINYGAAYCCKAIVKPNCSIQHYYQKEYCVSGWITKHLFQKSFLSTPTICFKAKAFENIRFDERLASSEDRDAWLRLSKKIKFLFVSETKAFVRVNHGVTPRSDFSRNNCYRIAMLERFYYRLGGEDVVPRSVAMKKLSKVCRSSAKSFYRKRYRKAAVTLFRRAIKYRFYDLRLWLGLVKSLLLKTQDDPCPEWEMPLLNI